MVNGGGIRRDIVAIGASAGGVSVLQQLFKALPADFPGTIATVIHRSPVYVSDLPDVLARRTEQTVIEPGRDERVARGRVYLAPRDLHMTFQDGRLCLGRGPKEHHTRPAVDPLFQSAAATFGPRVVGVLLTGAGDDGVDGMIAIKAAGGLAIVQDPDEAPYPWMPINAIAHDHIDLVLPLAEIAPALVALAQGRAVARETAATTTPAGPSRRRRPDVPPAPRSATRPRT